MEIQESFASLISSAVAAKMTPEFIEKEVDTRISKLIVESIDIALRRYSDTGKKIEKAIEDALRVDKLDLPSYGLTVMTILKTQIEAKVSELVAGRLAADMNEILNLAPKEIKLSKIAAEMMESHEGDEWGDLITVIVEPTEYGSTWVYLDEEKALPERDKYKAKFRLLISDGVIAAATIDEKNVKDTKHLGRCYGLDQRVRALYACGTKIELDEEYVVTSRGD